MGTVASCEAEGGQKTTAESGDGTITKEQTERAMLTMEVQDLRNRTQALESTLNIMNSQIAEKKGTASSIKMPQSFVKGLPQIEESAMATMTMGQIAELKSKLEDVWERQKERDAEYRKELFEISGLTCFAKNNNSASCTCLDDIPDEKLFVKPDDDELADAGSKRLYGVDWQLQCASQPSGPRDEAHRRKVREGTRAKVVTELGLNYFGQAVPGGQPARLPPASSKTTLFLDKSDPSKEGSAPAGDTYLLGRYDVICARVCADFDRSWSFVKGSRFDFWVAHAAALNIGESTEATDFEDFCSLKNNADNVNASGRLDLERYLEAMGQIIGNVVYACNNLKARHIVFFPFGMGAFMRHLGQLDGTFYDEFELQRVRRRLAHVFIDRFKRLSSNARLHICLQLSTEEAQRNADAFFRAIIAADKNFKKRITVVPEGDCLSVASELATTCDHVVLVNGANRQLLGNHWFAGRAKLAIDENLHRRSWRMGALSYLLNGFDGREPSGRSPDSLQRAVKAMSGKVQEIKPLK